MIAVHLEPGLHAIALDFETPGFSLGLKISLACLALFLALLIAALLARFTNPPIVKVPVKLADPRQEEDEPAPDAPPAAEPMPPRHATDMPPLDMTQAWADQGAGIGEQGAGGAGSERAVGSVHRRGGWPGEPEEKTPDNAERSGGAPAEDRDVLSTTGVFDPGKLPPEEPGSFDTLAYLERLDKLLEDMDDPPADG